MANGIHEEQEDAPMTEKELKNCKACKFGEPILAGAARIEDLEQTLAARERDCHHLRGQVKGLLEAFKLLAGAMADDDDVTVIIDDEEEQDGQ